MNPREILPAELWAKIFNYLNHPKDLSNNSLACQFFYDTCFLQRIADKAAHHVINGQEDLTRNIIETFAECLTQKVSVTDHFGRKFQDVYIFQLALWSLDTHYMCQTIIESCTIIPSTHWLLNKLYQQYLLLNEQGISYQYKNQTYREKHFDFQPIIQKLGKAHDTYAAMDTNTRTQDWIKQIGFEQGRLPIHALQHYCDPGLLFHQPLNLKQDKMLRTLWAYNWGREQDSNWYKHDTTKQKLGTDIAIIKSPNGQLTIVDQYHNLHEYNGHAALDQQFFIKLAKTRKDDFINIGKKLKLLAQNTYHQKDPIYDTITTMSTL